MAAQRRFASTHVVAKEPTEVLKKEPEPGPEAKPAGPGPAPTPQVESQPSGTLWTFENCCLLSADQEERQALVM